jgi:hypothetical protein
MRLGASGEDTRRKWAALPALATATPLGSARPGAVVLAAASAPGGAVFPVVAVQQYGRGRSMVFGGEASWRWRMMAASTDRSHELFWRQTARWLAEASPDPVAIAVPDAPQPGDSVSIDVDARDAAFAPVADAAVEATVELPGGDRQPLTFRRVAAPAGGHATFRLTRGSVSCAGPKPGAPARRWGSDRWIYVGGGDRGSRIRASTKGSCGVPHAGPAAATFARRRAAADGLAAGGGKAEYGASAGRSVGQAVGAGRARPALVGEWGVRRRWGLR